MSAIRELLQAFEHCSDLTHERAPQLELDYLYFEHLTGREELARGITDPLNRLGKEELEALLARSAYKKAESPSHAVVHILDGQVALVFREQIYLYDAAAPKERSVESSDTETTITGPKDSFTESISVNLSQIRRRIRSTRLKVILLELGGTMAVRVRLLYLEDEADSDTVEAIRKRIEEVTGTVTDVNELVQLLEEHPYSVFPQFYTTERPDQAAAHLLEGKIIGLLDGSPRAFCAPSMFYDFFSTQDDYYQRRIPAVVLRLLRFAALLVTFTATPLYVSLLTFHYEMIPSTLLFNLMESRNKVPFSPLIEAIVMEMTIELLREAGSRLPTKIGQTIGIVGGIVIGQAAVQAGITSNILIIAVAVSAVSSFAVPSYMMSTSIRTARYGIILMAGLLGNFGIIMGIGFMVVHLCSLSSFGVPYMSTTFSKLTLRKK
ncbi:spore germination protein [Gorillibacterium sp. sgz5001074]|uniref:spore germination protein n=1 Tax=Gorillibacterium sp. sgz5001074 TaxID=3446695 RepID=UPI003F668EF2